MKQCLGGVMGMAALTVVSGLAHAADSPFPAAPPGTPVAGAIGLGLLAAGAVALGVRYASRSK